MAKKKETTRVLLVNFDESVARNLEKNIGLEVYRGYLQDSKNYEVNELGVSHPIFNFYFPVAPYECSMIFIKLGKAEDAEKEFGADARMWGLDDATNFQKYWKKDSGKLVVFFIGDTRLDSLGYFGVPLDLQEVANKDADTEVILKEETDHEELVDELDRSIVMPTSRYIRTEAYEKDYHNMGTSLHRLIVNANNDNLAVALTKSDYDFRLESPAVLALPLFKNDLKVLTKIADHFSDYLGLKTVGSSSEWKNSDKLLPCSELNELEAKLEEIIKEAQDSIKSQNEIIAETKQKYSFLKDLVTAEGDVLVESVFRTLTEVLGLKATKSDEVNSSNQKEDLLIELGEDRLLLEVKGTKSQNPRLDYPDQALRHAKRQGMLEITSTGLILNHDRETEPTKRKDAYSSKNERVLIKEVHFIDTRVLHSLAIDVIDKNTSIKEAKEVLFGSLGRAKYSSK